MIAKTWNKQLSTGAWHDLTLAGFPGFHEGRAWTLVVDLKQADGFTAHKLEARIDDVVRDVFYARGLTKSGLPLVDPGEEYQMLVFFAHPEDMKVVAKMLDSDEFSGFVIGVKSSDEGFRRKMVE